MSHPFTLPNGVAIPSPGFGTYLMPEEPATVDAIVQALRLGYWHIDTAYFYGNETCVGEAIRASGLPREEIFVTSKVWNTDRGYQPTLAAFEKTMTHLGLDYLDLYLIHWPAYADKYENWEDINRETWRAMTELYQSGCVRAIGVSNFKPHHLKALLEGPVKPMVDQIELNPGWQQRETVAFCAQHDILIEAWSPLGRGRVLGHPLLAELGRKYGKTPAQICLRWCLDKGYLPLPKSVTPSRIQENLNIFDFALTPEDIARLDALPPFGESGRDPDNVPF